MTEYLNKGLLLAALNSMRINRNTPHAYYIQTGIDAVRDFVRDLPPSDVQEIKHGKWIFQRAEGSIFDDYFICSSCKYECHADYSYCPNCGAMMEE